MKNIKKGFTLIELLVVIAIIGILASIVLVSLNSARNKGRDARIISDVQQARTALESGFNGGGYPDLNYNATNCNAATVVTGATPKATLSNCTNASGPDSGVLGQLNSDANSQGGGLYFVVGSGNTSYALFGRLVSSNTTYFCIDSTGKTNQADNGNTSGTNQSCN